MATLYQVLDVPKDASGDEIKKAYRKLAKTKHPDVCQEEGAEASFKQIVEAYETLSDDHKRQAYDAALQQVGDEASIPLFNRMWDAYYNAPFKNVHARNGEDIRVTTSYKVIDLIRETPKTLYVSKEELCVTCEGYGYESKKAKVCSACKGQRTIPSQAMGMGEHITMHSICSECEGHGVVQRPTCASCKGGGKRKVTEGVSLTTPRHAHKHPWTRIREEGHVGFMAPNGDIWVEWKRDPSESIKIEGDDLFIKVMIPFKLAVLGGSHVVKLPDGTDHTCKVWPGTSDGDMESVQNAGLVNAKTNQRGKCYVQWQVQTPRGIEELSVVWKGAQP